MITEINSRTAATAKAVSKSPRSFAYIYNETVSVEPALSDCTASSGDSNSFAIPAVNSNAALSPVILPIASIQPVMIPSTAEGRTTVRIVYHFPAPRANAPSL